MKKSLPLLKSLSGIVCLIGIWQVTEGSQSLPIDRILTETDGPSSLEWIGHGYGWPHQILRILDILSQQKGLSFDQMKDQVYQNYLSLNL